MQDFKKNSKDVIRVQKKEFQGKHYLDIRTFYMDDGGEMRPTKKGISIPLDFAGAVLGAMQQELEGK